MDKKPQKRIKTLIKSVLFLAGSFTFAFLLAEMVHEFGHYIAHLAYRTPGVGIHIDPFGGTHITGVDLLTNEAMLVTTLAGPLTSLVLGIGTTLLLWRYRKPILLPLLLWGPVAMIQEGVNMSLGLLSPGSDAAWISALLLPGGLVLGIGILLLIGGVLAIPFFLYLAGIHPDQPFWQQLVILWVSMGALMLIRLVVSALVIPGSITENFIPLVFTFLLSVMVASLHISIIRRVNGGKPSSWIQIPNQAIITAWVLGGGLFFFQALAFNS
jgi:F0F1-type ATP synthase assembly protein I